MTLAAQYPQYVRPLIETTFNELVGECFLMYAMHKLTPRDM